MLKFINNYASAIIALSAVICFITVTVCKFIDTCNQIELKNQFLQQEQIKFKQDSLINEKAIQLKDAQIKSYR